MSLEWNATIITLFSKVKAFFGLSFDNMNRIISMENANVVFTAEEVGAAERKIAEICTINQCEGLEGIAPLSFEQNVAI